MIDTEFDARNMIRRPSPLDDLRPVLNAVSIPVQAVGRLTVKQALQMALVERVIEGENRPSSSSSAESH